MAPPCKETQPSTSPTGNDYITLIVAPPNLRALPVALYDQGAHPAPILTKSPAIRPPLLQSSANSTPSPTSEHRQGPAPLEITSPTCPQMLPTDPSITSSWLDWWMFFTAKVNMKSKRGDYLYQMHRYKYKGTSIMENKVNMTPPEETKKLYSLILKKWRSMNYPIKKSE